jgi:hypothetical protein
MVLGCWLHARGLVLKAGSKRVGGTSFNASRSQDFYPVDNTLN